MPDSPVDHSLASEAAAGASAGSIPRSCNIFYSFFFGSLIIHERIQRYIIACNELSPKLNFPSKIVWTDLKFNQTCTYITHNG